MSERKNWSGRILTSPVTWGAVTGHLIGEEIEGKFFLNQLDSTSLFLRRLLIEPYFSPRDLPHMNPYSWMPIYDTLHDPLYSLAQLTYGSLAEIPFQLPFIAVGAYLGYRLSRYPLLEKMRSGMDNMTDYVKRHRT